MRILLNTARPAAAGNQRGLASAMIPSHRPWPARRNRHSDKLPPSPHSSGPFGEEVMALDYLVCAGIFLPMGKAVELLPSVDDASPDARKAPEETTSSSQHCAKETTTCRCHTRGCYRYGDAPYQLLHGHWPKLPERPSATPDMPAPGSPACRTMKMSFFSPFMFRRPPQGGSRDPKLVTCS